MHPEFDLFSVSLQLMVHLDQFFDVPAHFLVSAPNSFAVTVLTTSLFAGPCASFAIAFASYLITCAAFAIASASFALSFAPLATLTVRSISLSHFTVPLGAVAFCLSRNITRNWQQHRRQGNCGERMSPRTG
jgi:hypothetical protein